MGKKAKLQKGKFQFTRRKNLQKRPKSQPNFSKKNKSKPKPIKMFAERRNPAHNADNSSLQLLLCTPDWGCRGDLLISRGDSDRSRGPDNDSMDCRRGQLERSM